MRIALAVIHLLALGIGLGAIFVRARAANRLRTSAESLRATLAADSFWALAAALWISTGLWRWLSSIEKSQAYYNTNHIFFAKLGFLGLVLALEIWPMLTLIGWRRRTVRGGNDPAELARKGRLIARISDVQMLLVVAMVVCAVMMARGYGSQ
jgi:putative membrane protein